MPRGLVRDTEHPLELARRDAIPRLTDRVDGEKPFPERKVRIVEDGADAHAELIAARVAIELPPAFEPRDPFARSAPRALNAARPPEQFQVIATFDLRTEFGDERTQVDIVQARLPPRPMGEP
jgi:hypothetical protein